VLGLFSSATSTNGCDIHTHLEQNRHESPNFGERAIQTFAGQLEHFTHACRETLLILVEFLEHRRRSLTAVKPLLGRGEFLTLLIADDTRFGQLLLAAVQRLGQGTALRE